MRVRFLHSALLSASSRQRPGAQAQAGHAQQKPGAALDETLMKWVGNSIRMSFQPDLRPILPAPWVPKKCTLVPLKQVWCMQDDQGI